MRAILLLAGIGNRLRPWTDDNPKCLLPVGGTPLLHRYLTLLPEMGAGEIYMVLGHQDHKIEHYVDTHFPRLEADFIHNPDYTLGNVISLWLAQRYLRGDCLVMDGDVLFAPALLEKLVKSPRPRCVLLDEGFEETGEEMKLMARGDRVWSIARQVNGSYDLVGEGVGFLKLDDEGCRHLVAGLRRFVAAGKVRCEYEDVLDEVFKEIHIGYERVAGLPWTEIDFPEDVEKAEREVLPRIRGARSPRFS
jgi:choline kinase